MIAKKIQSNICGMLKSFRSAASAIYGCHTPKLRARVHVWFSRAGRRCEDWRGCQRRWQATDPNALHPVRCSRA